MPSRPSRSSVSSAPVGTQWEEDSPPNPNGPLFEPRQSARLQRHADESALRSMFRRARLAAKLDLDDLAALLGEAEGYDSKISEAENGINGRHIQLRWFAPLMAKPAALGIILEFFCHRARMQMPVPVEEMTEEQAKAEALDELEASPDIKELIKGRIAKRRGLPPGRVPL